MGFLDLVVIRKPIFGEYLDCGLEVAMGESVNSNAILEELDAIGLKYEIVNSSVARIDTYRFCADDAELLGVIQPIFSKYGKVSVRV